MHLQNRLIELNGALTEGVAVAFTGPGSVTPEQVPAVAGLADEVFEVSPGWMIGHYPTLFRGDNAAWLRTFWDRARPVSLVAVWRGEIETFGRRLPVARVGMVCTRPEYRGRGLASVLLRDALAHLQAHGTALVVISGRGALYQRAGSRIFGDLREFFVDAAALAAGPASDFECVSPQVPDAAVLADMAHLHEREPVRYVRSAEDWRLLLQPSATSRRTSAAARFSFAGARAPWPMRCGTRRGSVTACSVSPSLPASVPRSRLRWGGCSAVPAPGCACSPPTPWCCGGPRPPARIPRPGRTATVHACSTPGRFSNASLRLRALARTQGRCGRPCPGC